MYEIRHDNESSHCGRRKVFKERRMPSLRPAAQAKDVFVVQLLRSSLTLIDMIASMGQCVIVEMN